MKKEKRIIKVTYISGKNYLFRYVKDFLDMETKYLLKTVTNGNERSFNIDKSEVKDINEFQLKEKSILKSLFR